MPSSAIKIISILKIRAPALTQRRQWQPTPVLLPGKSHGWRSLVGCSPRVVKSRVGHDGATSLSLFTFMHWRRKWQPTPVFLPGESQGRGAWWAAVYGVAQSWTRLKWLSSSSSSHHGHQNWFAPAPFKLLKQLRSCDLISSFVKQLKNISFHTQHLSYGLIVMI